MISGGQSIQHLEHQLRQDIAEELAEQQNLRQQQLQPQLPGGPLAGVVNGNNPGQNNNAGNGGNNGVAGAGLVGGGTSAAAAKNQLEQLNTMREALFSQDGWGCQHVNQDTNWDVPGSPEPQSKDPTAPMWKPNINNGTELWEANIRNGGQPPPQPVQKTPWGHTPSTNLGGTWGEDDDGTDTSNVWTGTPANPTGAPQWGQGGGGGAGGGGGVGGGAVNAGAGAQQPPPLSIATQQKLTGGGGGGVAGTGGGIGGVGGGAGGVGGVSAANAWGDPRDMRGGPSGGVGGVGGGVGGVGPIDIRNVDPRDLRTASGADPRDNMRMIDPREQMREMRGDPRGISGRLNGTPEMWGQHHQIAHGQIPLNKMAGGPGTAAAVAAVASAGGANAQPWGAAAQQMAGGGVGGGVGGPKDMGGMANKSSSGWEEPSPPPQRRNLQNYDDGTSLWGQQSRVPGGGSHWKEMSDPMSRNHLNRGAIGNQNAGAAGAPGAPGGNVNAPMVPQGRLGGGPAVGQIKADNNMWGHAPNTGIRNNGAWGDDPHSGATGANWGDDKSSAMGNLGGTVGTAWNDSNAATVWNKNQNKMSAAGQVWQDSSDLGSEWGSHSVNKPPAKLSGLNSELTRSSKQYRVLVEMGFKKDDAERALIQCNLNLEEAVELLNTRGSLVGMDSWRRHDEPITPLGNFDHASAGFPGRFPSTGPQPAMPFPPNNNPNMLNNIGGGNVGVNPNLTALNSMQPLQVQKYLNQAPHNVTGAQSVSAAAAVFCPGTTVAAAAVNAAAHNSAQPSTQQLRMLVQQIQMAVQNGYLSNQILNQPLAPTTLILLNQLLNAIKNLQGVQSNMQRTNNVNMAGAAVSKYKQQIANLQNQISAQQSVYVKQQQQQQQQQQQPQHVSAGSHVGSSTAEYMRGHNDAISALQSNFSEINLNKPGGYQSAPSQQSRLNQWKLPVLEKDGSSDSTDFARAPGATTKPSLSAANANNMGALGMQGDGRTWSSSRNISDGWPDTTNDNENKDWPAVQPSTATAFTDLVPEFEPGKPWKGSQIKSIEDDPSITPGSVARSPLSINATPKEAADIFANTSKNSPTDLPPLGLSSSTWSFNPSGSNQNFPSWSDNVPQSSATSSELWVPPMNKTSRGPPPGLGANKGASVSVASATNPSGVSGGGSNGWIGSGLGGRVPSANTNWSGANSSWNSNWLLLKNLTTQIDGSTLRTLCMQHGPLSTFHLYLNQGIALCKYATREEANKAQMTLNNCVLGNTTICAESPNETEVQSILQHLPTTVGQSQGGNVSGATGVAGGNVGGSNVGGASVGQNNDKLTAGVGVSNSSQSGNTGSNGASNAGNPSSAWRPQNQPNQSRPSDTWGAVWHVPNPATALWTPLDAATERGTPSNLKPFLPENLLELN